MSFAHLHCHSDYSFLDGVGKSIEYAEIAARNKHNALALTDHGNLYGLPEHRRACKDRGIKPIAGCEFYVNDTRDQTKEIITAARGQKIDKSVLDPTFTDAHLVLLAMSPEGWKNMLKVNHDAVRNGYYYKPRTTHDFVCSNAAGLVATTTCIGSLFNRLALRGDEQGLGKLLRQFKDAFGDRFYREVHLNELPDQKKANAVLARHCDRLGIPAFLAADVHYACKGDDARQDEMIAVARRLKVDDPKGFKLSTRDLWFTGPRDIYQLQQKWGYGHTRNEIAAWCAAAGEIADRCEADIYPDDTLKPPRYIGDDGKPVKDSVAHLNALAAEGYRRRVLGGGGVAKPEVYAERLRYEREAVAKLGLADFYLVTLDVVRFCRSRGIMVWTRGSGTASLLAALIGITPIDPVRFGLLFERFLDPDRPSPPDFDLDIDSSRRQEVIDWLTKKYGGPNGERIARICSVQTYGLRSALRDVLGSRGADPGVAARLADCADRMEPAVGAPVPRVERELADATVPERAAVLDKAIAELSEVARADDREFIGNNTPLVRDALTMVGRARGRSTHAAGFVVGPDDLVNHVPIDRAVSDGDKVITTAWTEGQHAQDIGPTGLLKLDLLGLETLAAVDAAAKFASERTGRDVVSEIDGWSMDYADPKTLAELRTGDGFGLHQLQETNQGLARFLKDLRPTRVEDLIAAVAAYRPGSMEHLGEFVERARGRAPTPVVHPVYDDETSETRGIIIYQEQIMRLLNRLAGFPMRKAYKVIKAISKKDEKTITASREEFERGAAAAKVPQAVIDRVWKDIAASAGYSFNKAHAASYGTLSWATAYLRGRYPTEFWWAWLSRTPNETKGKGKNKVRKAEILMRRARARAVPLVAPAAGRSTGQWRVLKDGRLLAPLSLVIGVGPDAANETHEAWKTHRWKDLWSFLAWCESHGRVLSSRAVAALAHAGALREWCPVPYAVDAVAVYAEVKATRRDGMRWEQARDAVTQRPLDYLTTIPDEETETAFERQAFGFSFWRDPWECSGRREFALSLIASGRVAPDNPTGDRIRGKRRPMCVRDIRLHKDKRRREMAFVELETVTGRSIKGVVFSSVWSPGVFVRDRVYLVMGEFDKDGSYLIGGSTPAVPIDDVMARENRVRKAAV